MSNTTRQKYFVVIDIDGTIAEGHTFNHLEYYNKHANLNLSQQYIDHAATKYPTTTEVPAIIRLERKSPNLYLKLRQEIHYSDQLAYKLSPINNSQIGIRSLLNNMKFGGYYTARKCSLECTTNWLRFHKFPNPNNIKMVKDHKEKLKAIINDYFTKSDNLCLLVDDNPEQLSLAFEELAQDFQYSKYLHRITIVSFGKNKIEQQTQPKIVNLQNWDISSTINLMNSINV